MSMLDDLARLAKAATPGAWTHNPPRGAVLDDDGGLIVLAYGLRIERNAKFIAAAGPAVVLQLLEVINAAKEMREQGSHVQLTNGQLVQSPAAQRFDTVLRFFWSGANDQD